MRGKVEKTMIEFRISYSDFMLNL